MWGGAMSTDVSSGMNCIAELEVALCYEHLIRRLYLSRYYDVTSVGDVAIHSVTTRPPPHFLQLLRNNNKTINPIAYEDTPRSYHLTSRGSTALIEHIGQ